MKHIWASPNGKRWHVAHEPKWAKEWLTFACGLSYPLQELETQPSPPEQYRCKSCLRRAKGVRMEGEGG